MLVLMFVCLPRRVRIESAPADFGLAAPRRRTTKRPLRHPHVIGRRAGNERG